MTSSLDALARRFVPWLVRHRIRVLAVAGAVAAVSAFFAARLYGDLRSEVEELLPANAPSVVAAKQIGPKLHSVNQLFVVFEGNEPRGMQRFADALAAKLHAMPGIVESVNYRTDQEDAFLRKFGAFYLSTEDLRTVLSRIRKRVGWEKQRLNPLTHLLDEDPAERTPPPPVDFSDIEEKYGVGQISHFRDGYYQTPDGKLLAMLVIPPESNTGYTANKRLTDAVTAAIHAIDPKNYDGTMKIGYSGEVMSLLEEQEALVKDLASSTVVVIFLVTLVLYLYYRRWGSIFALLGSLAVGVLVTFGISYFVVGHLNANTAFLGSIVIGNGINVGIIFMARYREERTRGVEMESAVVTAWRGTLAATFMASFAAGLAYLSLGVTDFRGFNQFGVIGGIGMATCWLSAYLLLPSIVATLEGWWPAHFTRAAGKHPWSGRVSRFVGERTGMLRVVSIGLLVLSAIFVSRYQGPLVEYDVSKVRSKKSLKQGAVFWSTKVDQIFRAYLTPIVIWAETPDELDRVVQVLELRRNSLGSADPIREVRSIHSVLPRDAASKLPLVRELRNALNDTRLDALPKDLREKAEQLRPPPDPMPPRLPDLPISIRLPLEERDGTVGRVALAFPGKVGVLNTDDLEDIARIVRGSIRDSGVRAKAVSQTLLFADISAAILRDGPKATYLAFFAVCALVLVVLRRLAPAAMVWGALVLGVAYLVGAAAAANVRINFLNFVVLPITFGIGVDYAVNIIQRYRLEGEGSLGKVIRETGGAVALASCTTIIGYSSLLVADNLALKGFGLLASLGEVMCLTAALIMLPAWIFRFEPTPEQTAHDAHSPLL